MSDRRGIAAQQFQNIVDSYQGPLIGYATRVCGDAERARDVVQETLLKLWSADPPVELDRAAQWLFTVCRNGALDVRRKETRMTTLNETWVQGPSPQADDPAWRAERREDAQVALAALATLPGNQQEVLRLKLQNDFTYRQIAGITGLSVSNVGFLIHTGIQNIRRKLAAAASRPAGE